MTDIARFLRYAAAFALLGWGLGGTAAALLGVETLSPAYFGVAIAAGATALPESHGPLCRLRSRLPV